MHLHRRRQRHGTGIDRNRVPVDRLDLSLSLVDQVLLSTEDDGFPPAVVDFGGEPSVTLAAGDGHPMLWIFSGPNAGFSVRDLLSQLRPQRPHSQRRLDWSVLRPPELTAE